jgi:hypothetical protein
MTTLISSSTLRQAVADAVDLVNSNPGQASVSLLFQGGEFPELDFVANSAFLEGEQFVFTSGFERFGGSLKELTSIRAELIH